VWLPVNKRVGKRGGGEENEKGRNKKTPTKRKKIEMRGERSVSNSVNHQIIPVTMRLKTRGEG